MTASKTASAVSGRDAALEAFRAEGCSAPRSWGNGPGEAYGPHAHGLHKVLFCLGGSITFHLDDDDVELAPGDRLDIEPGTEHAATVGPNGCSCVEASR
ncbi:MAG TPA: cupin domain-containing protein [Actinomycetota bacterium]|nr:cupin domain-containing protein [Actinomycetota bacterium]